MSENTEPVTREGVMKLINQKEALEKEIKDLGNYLESQNRIGMHESLVDQEGYPRMDVDVYQIRHARHKIICLQNDHKALMKRIEDHLHKLHANSKPEIEIEQKKDDFLTNKIPFARVENIGQNSPAEIAGLQSNDLIVKFGSVTPDNFKTLQNIATVVQHSIGRPINLTVMRNSHLLHLKLIPNNWDGKGLIGCNFVPIN